MKIHNSAILETFLNANGVCEYSNKKCPPAKFQPFKEQYRALFAIVTPSFRIEWTIFVFLILYP